MILFQSSVLVFLTVTNHTDFFQFFPNYYSELLFRVTVFIIYESFQSKKIQLKAFRQNDFLLKEIFRSSKKIILTIYKKFDFHWKCKKELHWQIY